MNDLAFLSLQLTVLCVALIAIPLVFLSFLVDEVRNS